jgi:hypothetical protein
MMHLEFDPSRIRSLYDDQARYNDAVQSLKKRLDYFLIPDSMVSLEDPEDSYGSLWTLNDELDEVVEAASDLQSLVSDVMEALEMEVCDEPERDERLEDW